MERERRESLREKYAVNMNEEEEEEEEEEEFIEDLEDLGGGGGGKGKGGNVVGKITRDLPNQPKNGFVFGGHHHRNNTSNNEDNDKENHHSVPGTQRIHVKTFGCAHNHSDSEFMSGQLQAYGYKLTDDPSEANLWVVNTCTVKNPSQAAMNTVLARAKTNEVPVVVCGCVPQGDQKAKELAEVSLLGVSQIDRIVEAVERTLRGERVLMLEKKSLPKLDLPKVRRNERVEIIPLSTGCLGQCTYCKTKHARGELGSYEIEAIIGRAKLAIEEGVTEIWLSSEDTGAYGLDIGSNVAELFKALVDVLPADQSVMLRLGMTNPPYILAHLPAIAEAMRHPSVFSWIHIPVQSGSSKVLDDMKREYTREEFEQVCDYLLEHVPDITIATDIICGFPGETESEWRETMSLIEKYKFPEVHISQFYARPNTPAFRMKRVNTLTVKNRSRELTKLTESYFPWTKLEGQKMKVWITDIAADGVSLVGHTKSYSQILLPGGEENVEKYMGTSAHVKVLSSSRWSCKAEIIENESEAAAGIQSSTSLHKKIALVESAGDTSNLNKKYGKKTRPKKNNNNNKGDILADVTEDYDDAYALRVQRIDKVSRYAEIAFGTTLCVASLGILYSKLVAPRA